jgi:hypothetical protein
MRNKDTILLEDCYNKVLTNEGLGKTLATGALAATTMLQGLKATPQQYPQDQDGAAIESHQNPELDPEENFKKAVDMVHGRQQVPENILNSISSNPELAARLAYVYELKQLQLPKALQKYARHPRAIGG